MQNRSLSSTMISSSRNNLKGMSLSAIHIDQETEDLKQTIKQLEVKLADSLSECK